MEKFKNHKLTIFYLVLFLINFNFMVKNIFVLDIEDLENLAPEKIKYINLINNFITFALNSAIFLNLFYRENSELGLIKKFLFSITIALIGMFLTINVPIISLTVYLKLFFGIVSFFLFLYIYFELRKGEDIKFLVLRFLKYIKYEMLIFLLVVLFEIIIFHIFWRKFRIDLGHYFVLLDVNLFFIFFYLVIILSQNDNKKYNTGVVSRILFVKSKIASIVIIFLNIFLIYFMILRIKKYGLTEKISKELEEIENDYTGIEKSYLMDKEYFYKIPISKTMLEDNGEYFIEKSIETAAKAAVCIVNQNCDTAMNRYNTPSKKKRIDKLSENQ